MQKAIKQTVALKLRRRKDKHGKKHWVVGYGRKKKDGKIGWATTEWKIRTDSWLPKPVFYAVVNSIFFQTKKIAPIDKCFAKMDPKIRVALSNAAPVCGCAFKENDFDGRMWLLDGKPFLDFMVVDYEKHHDQKYKGPKLLALADELRERRPKFMRMERKSRAMFRVVIAVLKKGGWKFVPGKTLPEGERRHG